MRLLQAFGRHVTQKVQSLQARSVAEVKPRHRIHGTSARGLRLEEVISSRRQQDLADAFGTVRIVLPSWLIENAQHCLAVFTEAGRFLDLSLPREPSCEAGNRRERHEGFQVRQLAFE